MSLALPFDPFLVLAVFGIAIVSLVTLKGATSNDIKGSPDYYVVRQAMFFAIGTMGAVLVSRIDYSRLREFKYAIYGALILGILAVYPLGTNTNGSRRSIPTPIFETVLNGLTLRGSIVGTRQDMVEETWRIVQPLLDHPPEAHGQLHPRPRQLAIVAQHPDPRLAVAGDRRPVHADRKSVV